MANYMEMEVSEDREAVTRAAVACTRRISDRLQIPIGFSPELGQFIHKLLSVQKVNGLGFLTPKDTKGPLSIEVYVPLHPKDTTNEATIHSIVDAKNTLVGMVNSLASNRLVFVNTAGASFDWLRSHEKRHFTISGKQEVLGLLSFSRR